MVIVVLSVLMYIIGIALAYRATRNLLSPPMFVLYIWGFAVTGGIGYFMAEGHYLTALVPGVASATFGLGLRLFSLATGFSANRDLRDITSQQLSYGIANRSAFRLALVLSLMVILIAAFIVLRRSPLFNPDIKKINMVLPGMGLLARLVKSGLPILSVICVLAAIKTNKLRNWIATALTILVTVSALMLTGFKGYVLWFVVLLTITLGSLKPRNRKVKYAIAIGAVFAVASVIVMAYVMPYASQGSLTKSIQFTWKRLTTEETRGLDYILYDLVPEHGFYGGETMFWDFASQMNELTQGVLFQQPHPELTDYVADLIKGYPVPSGNTTMIMGDLYANWGVLGVVFGAFLYGCLLEVLYTLVLRTKKTVMHYPFWVYVNWLFVRIASTGSPISVLLSGVTSLFVVYGLICTVYTYFYVPFINHARESEVKV